MSRLFLTIPVDHEEVKKIVSEYFGLTLEKIIKGSQNHTFIAKNSNDEQFAVRVTPDPENQHWQRINDEIFFVNFVVESNGCPDVCNPIPTIKPTNSNSLSDKFVVRSGDLTVVAFRWAKGSPVNFLEYRWMTDSKMVKAWGSWFAKFHRVSRNFTKQYPDIVARIQRWDQVHDSVMAGTPLHEADVAAMKDPLHYGVIHSDVNTSNFFFMEDEAMLSVYDWDQTEQGWYLMDLAQACNAVHMLHQGGSIIDGSTVAKANPIEWVNWLWEGYVANTAEEDKAVLDRERLSRMIAMRKLFYKNFCKRAAEEGEIPADMKHFINYVNNWMAKNF